MADPFYDAVPDCAETIDALPHLLPQKVPSKYLPGMKAIIPVFACPGCGTRQQVPKHGKTFSCDGHGCTLSMQLRGSSLLVWREKVPA